MNSKTSKSQLWEFTDSLGSFRVEAPTDISRLYFPLANDGGLLSSITPDLHGDIKSSHNSFLTQPVTIEDLHNTKSNRNFWVYFDEAPNKKNEDLLAWSLTGVSAIQDANKCTGKNKEKVTLDAGVLWHKVTRENQGLGLKSEIVNFAPAGSDRVEIMVVTLTNTGSSKIKITPTSAIPIFGRSADNLRDHQHVTSLLHRILSHSAGVIVKPTMSFDERGHKLNETQYCVLGFEANGDLPLGAFPTVQDFVGEGGDFESPRAVFENWLIPQKDTSTYHGKPAIGALRFKTLSLAPGKKASYVMLLGIAEKETEIDGWIKKYGSLLKAESALKETKTFWENKLNSLKFNTGDPRFSGWARWVGLQPTLRKLFGCSFLPDFDYGRGGRGWRDLWQDCLALLLTNPAETRSLLIHNFNGVRIDGSNATIIGSNNNEFIADRNNITRVWMDHGVWPFVTLELYIHQTGDLDILFEPTKYFRDRQQSRARHKDTAWTEEYGRNLKTKTGAIAQGSILEHMLVQHLVQFFNVGEHNHIRLENADWNDGLDMAYERGESVAFTTLYASNLKRLADVIEKAAAVKGLTKVELAKELLLLLDSVAKPKVNYYSPLDKQKRLGKYFLAVEPAVSGRKVAVSVKKLAQDLREKSNFIFEHVRKKEWVQTNEGDGFYNGYYDNRGRRVEGEFPGGLRMTLAGQVFPIMSGVATPEQVTEIFKTAKKYLKDKELGGFRLNTPFHEIRPDLGRAFSFAYGEKENGAFFSHMAVMFANALYQRGFAREGFQVLDSIYKMCVNTPKSKIFPGIPEYFNSEGRGLYHYLTGSASWLILTLLTQVYGVRGYYGDLLLEPKLTKEQFGVKGEASVSTSFADKLITVVYRNPKKIESEQTYITKVSFAGQDIKGLELNKKSVLIPRQTLLKLAKKGPNQIIVTLE